MAGDFQGLGEPALALTPPTTPSAADDGLLTASEVALLKLNADWVILSACNTAPDGSPGAEGPPGLARAFLYAGGRSLVVSHRPVASQAAVRLTTSTLQEYAGGTSKVQALKRAMAVLRADTSNPEFAHPGIWSPFVVVGGQ
jgi:CHAT domain-containing protein